MLKLRVLALTALTVTVLTACGKKAEDPPAPAPAAIPQAQVPAAPAPTQPEAAAPAEDPEVLAKRQAIEFALAEQKIAEDPLGQWATTAKASSTYNDAKDKASYSDWQVTGAPNVVKYGDNGNSWAAKEADGGIESILVGFANPVNATEIRIRQSHAPGAIIKIELIDDKNSNHTVFEGIDSNKYPANTITWFVQPFEKTTYLVTGAKITLATNAVPSWNEIDAVQLIGTAAPATAQ
jgi:hypothetical protein